MIDVASLVGAYALDAVSDAERQLVDQHLLTCAECRDDLASFRETTVLLSGTVAAPRTTAARARTLAAARNVRPLPPSPAPDHDTLPPAASGQGHGHGVSTESEENPTALVTPLASRTPTHRAEERRPRWVWLAAAAVVLAAVGVGAGLEALHQRSLDDDRSTAAPSPTQLVLDAPDAQAVRIEVGEARATVVRSKSQGRAVLVTEDMPPAPDGSDYEVWFQRPDGDMVPAGTMPRRTDQTLLLDGDATDATAVAVTIEPSAVEPAGADADDPSSEPVVLFDLTG